MDKLEEIKKLKQLLDEGVIDEIDFKNKKAQILGLYKENQRAEKVVEEETKNTTKSKSLEEYERELMKQTEIEDNRNKSNTKSNDDFYQREKLKAKARLDAEEEIRNKRRAEQRKVVDKGVNKTKRILKWVLAVILWLFTISSFCIAKDSGLVYIPTGILFLVLGCMACPKITDKTQKYEAYTMHKIAIVWIILIIMLALVIIFPTNSSQEDNNTSNTNVVEESK